MREIRTSGSEEGFAGVTRRIYSPIMNCIYFYAPSEKAASDLVQFAVDYAKEENAKIEKQKAVESFEIPMDFLKKSNEKNNGELQLPVVELPK